MIHRDPYDNSQIVAERTDKTGRFIAIEQQRETSITEVITWILAILLVISLAILAAIT